MIDERRAARSKIVRGAGAVFGLALALGATCEPTSPSRADDPAPTSTMSAPRSVEPGFDPELAALGVVVSAARDAIASGRFDDARASVAAASADDAGVIRYRLAAACVAAGSIDDAIALYQAVVDADHPLALASRIELGRRSTDAEAARDAVEPACAASWPGQAEACAVFALASSGLPEERARIDAALERSESLAWGDRAALVVALAAHLAEEDDDSRVRAVELLRSLGDARPSAPATLDADARALAIVERLAEERRAALRPIGSGHALARADALGRSNAHVEAAHAYHAIAEHTRASDPAHCAALLGEGRAMYRARERAAAATHLDAMISHCSADPDVSAQALYFAGKAYVALGHDDTAIARFDALVDRAPAHRLADDARYEAAAIELRSGATDAARTHLRALIEGPADADMRPDALFLLGWTERRAGALDAALAAFDGAMTEGGSESREDLGGRIAYWRARTLADLGRAEEARAAWEALAASRPLSYYGRHARGRLGDVGVVVADPTTAATALSFARRSALDAPGFARALACLRCGETALAERELDALGFSSTSDDHDVRWLAVALLSHAGESERAVTRTRGTLVRELLGARLDARSRALFELAYPRGYADVVTSGASDAEVPSALVFGLIREESSFAPSAVSIAHAYGLMQLIRPTARRLARPLGLASDPAALLRPDVNVRLGTRYLGELHDHYAAGPEVVPAAYNAGQGAVDRWLRERGDTSLDEFVETIPYAETRGYTRRVIQSWGIYAFLDTGRIEPLGRALPAL